MMKNSILSVDRHTVSVDVALLLLRVGMGSAFALLSWGKIQQPLNWMPPEMGFAPVFQALAAVAEFVGGLALILGLLTRLAAFGIFCTMAVAVYMHIFVFGDPFVNTQGGGSYNIALTYLLISLLLMLSGPGRLSLDRLLFGVKEQRQLT